MKVFESAVAAGRAIASDSACSAKGYAATIGNFDGVHRGHQKVLTELIAQAQAHGMASLAITFDPHPSMVHQPDSTPQLITGLEEKLRRLADTGLDAVLVQPYSLDFAQQTPGEFIADYLADTLHVKRMVIGQDIRFGKDNSGDLHTLIDEGPARGIDEVTAIDDLLDDGSRISSTAIRKALLAGNVTAASEAMGRNHVVSGTVVHGNARGREMGFPTVNIGGDVQGLIPADGVYAGWVYFADGRQLPGAISVGSNPTFEGDDRRVEVHVVGVEFPDMDVYGQPACVEFVSHIRGQVAFTGMEALIQQIHEDVRQVSQVLCIDD